MTAVKSFKEHQKANIIKTDKGFNLLKTAAIYGPNGGGKSNFVYAINSMSNFIQHSFSESLLPESERKRTLSLPFFLNTRDENNNTMYEVSFLKDMEVYRYGFEVKGSEIKKEWLYRKKEREVLLFNRTEGNVFEINSESFEEGDKYKSEVNANVLFISHLAQNNQKISRTIVDWFSNVNVISGLHEEKYGKYTAKLLKTDTNFKKWAASVLKYLEVTNVEADEKDGEIVTYHNKFDENDLLIGVVPFDVSVESTGTKKLIHMLGPVYDTLRNGRILFVDEFDSKLHPNLSCGLIHLFQELNKRGAQLVFSAHDVTLLNKKLFRRDQIWFVRRDQFGASELYPMSDFSSSTVRNSSAFDKKYLDNVFGTSEKMDIKNVNDLVYV
ncbi:hypothetical protein WSM22_40480 [Cytophagales bacterium WSM2-2]|nr:hypothetical protein WSM22_40480 [Cytophagales bacterium WSM2-2]